jgi:hypothetical protein
MRGYSCHLKVPPTVDRIANLLLIIKVLEILVSNPWQTQSFSVYLSFIFNYLDAYRQDVIEIYGIL